jgi:hypothetical protein
MTDDYKCCTHDDFKCVDEYLDGILQAVINSCDICIPKQVRCCGKSKDDVVHNVHVKGWNVFVKQSHVTARRAYKRWIQSGRPKDGDVYSDMCESRRVFKRKLRECKGDAERKKADKFAGKFIEKDYRNFWKEVHKHKTNGKSGLISSIDGVTGRDMIGHWKDKYEKMFNERDFENSKQKFFECNQGQTGDMFYVTEADVSKALQDLKSGKAVGDDNIHAEALKLGSGVLSKHLCVLFNMWINCGYVPKQIMRIRLCPILKDRAGDVNSSDNYRLVAVASSISKLFESVLLNYLKQCIPVSETQFGFREGYSTDICTDVLKKTINDFCDKGSYVFALFVDLSKAFDTVNFWKLFAELESNGVAGNVVNVLAYAYSNEELRVSWQGNLSESFSRSSGTRQGSPLSPFLFSVYINSVLKKLAECDAGCRIRSKTVNHIAYADDIVLLSPSWRGLQQLMDILSCEIAERDLMFNYKKTKCMVFPPKHKSHQFLSKIHDFVLDKSVIEFCDSYKHLGHVLVSNRSDVSDMRREMRLLFFRTNILVGLFGNCNLDVKKLLWQAYINCFYGASIWSLEFLYLCI